MAGAQTTEWIVAPRVRTAHPRVGAVHPVVGTAHPTVIAAHSDLGTSAYGRGDGRLGRGNGPSARMHGPYDRGNRDNSVPNAISGAINGVFWSGHPAPDSPGGGSERGEGDACHNGNRREGSGGVSASVAVGAEGGDGRKRLKEQWLR